MKRRQFLVNTIKSLIMLMYPGVLMSQSNDENIRSNEPIMLFLCGDVMTGRGIDQVLPHSVDPQLHEPYVRTAKEYVEIAEAANGAIPKPVAFDYIWGDALKVFEFYAPAVRIINLETSITRSNNYWPLKGINYRMHPGNVPCLVAAGIDCCVLANNHVLDWGYEGLTETLNTLHDASIQTTGAGSNLEQARAPAILEVAGKGRVVVFSYGLESSGVIREWTAKTHRAGVNRLPDLSRKTVKRIRDETEAVKRAGDIVVASIHWGANWGYDIPGEHRQFAHQLIDLAGVDIIHGHSSHHPLGIEVHNDKPVIYGCGDFLNDYEGISGHEQYRDDLTLMYFIRASTTTGKLMGLEMVPMQIRRFRLQRASQPDALWLQATLDRECKKFKHGVEFNEKGNLVLDW